MQKEKEKRKKDRVAPNNHDDIKLLINYMEVIYIIPAKGAYLHSLLQFSCVNMFIFTKIIKRSHWCHCQLTNVILKKFTTK